MNTEKQTTSHADERLKSCKQIGLTVLDDTGASADLWSIRLTELHRVALTCLLDAHRAENELASRREVAFEAVYALCLGAMRRAGGGGPPQTQPPVGVAADEPRFPALDFVTRATITTEEASFYLNRRPQTLRGWACHEDGPIRPTRVFGRLAWPVVEIRQLLTSGTRSVPEKARQE